MIKLYNKSRKPKRSMPNYERQRETSLEDKDVVIKLEQALKQVESIKERLQSVLRKVNNEVSDFSEHACDMNTAVDEGIVTCRSQMDKINQISRVVCSIGEVADKTFGNMDVLADNYRKMEHFNSKGNNMLAELVDISRSTQASVNSINEQTRITNDSAMEIKKVTALITQIATRTNLLSLNASIEAARAGEAGRGFTIVANEIRTLANQSKESATKITQVVDVLISNSNASVSVTDNVTEMIESQNVKLNETSDVFEGLNREMQGLSEAIEEVTLVTIELEGLKDAVTDRVEELVSISDLNEAGSKKVKISMNTFIQKAETFEHTVKEMTELSDELENSITCRDCYVS